MTIRQAKITTGLSVVGIDNMSLAMNTYEFREYDFENPSILFLLEDKLKNLVGGPLLYNAYVRTFGLKGDEKILDFGCGGGAGSKCLLRHLNENGYLTCVDISSFWIEQAKKRLKKYPNVACQAGDIRELDIPDSSFDVISIFHVIHDISPAERQGTINVLSRKLKDGGRLFIREPIRESHGMPVGEIQGLMAEAGLRETDNRKTKSEYMGKFQRTA